MRSGPRGLLLAGLLGALLPVAAAGEGEAAEEQASSEPRAQTAGAPLRISSGPQREISAVVAWNSTDTEYLVVWEDWRSYGGARGIDLYGRRVDADGARLGGAFRISRPADVYDDRSPAVAWNAARNEYLVVWDRSANLWDPGRTDEVFGRRIKGDGTFAGPVLQVSGPVDYGGVYSPAVAWNSVHNQYLVVWHDNRDDDDLIYGRRVNGNGTFLGSEFRVGGTLATDTSYPGLAFKATRTEYLVVWEDGRGYDSRRYDIYARRVDADGTRRGKDFRVSGPGAVENDYSPVVAWNTSLDQYLVVWNDERNWELRSTDIYGVRLDGADGSRLGGDVLLSEPDAILGENVTALGWSATAGRYLMVLNDDRTDFHLGLDVYGQRITGNGARQGDPFRIVAPKGSAALDDSDDSGGVLAWNDASDEYLVVWMDGRLVVPPGFNLDIWGRRVAG